MHSASVGKGEMGKGETEAGVVLCAVEGKKTPDFLSWVLYPSHHPTVQHLKVYNCHLCFRETVVQGVVTENSPKNPFWQLSCCLPAPRQPTAPPV